MLVAIFNRATRLGIWRANRSQRAGDYTYFEFGTIEAAAAEAVKLDNRIDEQPQPIAGNVVEQLSSEQPENHESCGQRTVGTRKEAYTFL